jgi:hypothetical protein
METREVDPKNPDIPVKKLKQIVSQIGKIFLNVPQVTIRLPRLNNNL